MRPRPLTYTQFPTGSFNKALSMGPMTPEGNLARPILMTIPSKTKKSFYEQKVQ